MNDLFLSIGSSPPTQVPKNQINSKVGASGQIQSFQGALKSCQESQVDENVDQSSQKDDNENTDPKTEITIGSIQVVSVQSMPIIDVDTVDSLSQPATETTDSTVINSSYLPGDNDQVVLINHPDQIETKGENILHDDQPVGFQQMMTDKKLPQPAEQSKPLNVDQSVVKPYHEINLINDSERNSDDISVRLQHTYQPFTPHSSGTIDETVLIGDVFESARPAETQSGKLIHQVGAAIDNLVQKGDSSIRLQLYPQHLGRIELTVISRQNGVEINLLADTPAAQRILESDLNNLRQQLTANGIEIANLNIGQHSPQSWANGSNAGYQNHFKSGKTYSESDADFELSSAPILTMALSGIDYKV